MKHNGGKCPYKPDQVVQYMIRVSPRARYSPYPTTEARNLRWHHDGGAGDVVYAKPVAA